MPVTWEQIFTAGGFVLLVFGSIAGIWWRIDGRLRSAETALSAYKTHVAETYLPRSGLDRAVEQIMGAVSDLKTSLDRVSDRINRITDQDGHAARLTR